MDSINEDLDFDKLTKIISLSPLRRSLNMWVLVSTAKDNVKCIFASCSKYLHFGVFTVTFLVSFLVSFYDHFSAKHQKWSKNEAKNEPKITQKWLLWTTLLSHMFHCLLDGKMTARQVIGVQQVADMWHGHSSTQSQMTYSTRFRLNYLPDMKYYSPLIFFINTPHSFGPPCPCPHFSLSHCTLLCQGTLYAL